MYYSSPERSENVLGQKNVPNSLDMCQKTVLKYS